MEGPAAARRLLCPQRPVPRQEPVWRQQESETRAARAARSAARRAPAHRQLEGGCRPAHLPHRPYPRLQTPHRRGVQRRRVHLHHRPRSGESGRREPRPCQLRTTCGFLPGDDRLARIVRAEERHRHAPLKPSPGGWPGLWYDHGPLPDGIELMLVDGPHWAIHPFGARGGRRPPSGRSPPAAP